MSAAAPAFAGRAHWPAATTGHDAPVDPIQGVRWNSEGWVLNGTAAPAMISMGEVDNMLAVRADDAALHGARAVVLRVLRRFDESQRELVRAVALDPRVLDDPDVSLTKAYLAAREGHYADAVATARHALPRLDGADEMRGQIVLEVVRWSMARGPEGLDDAISLLREMTGPTAAAAMARATLCLALHRRGRDDEAREVARGRGPALAVLRPPCRAPARWSTARPTPRSARRICSRVAVARRWRFLERRSLARGPRVWRASPRPRLSTHIARPATPPSETHPRMHAPPAPRRGRDAAMADAPSPAAASHVRCARHRDRRAAMPARAQRPRPKTADARVHVGLDDASEPARAGGRA